MKRSENTASRVKAMAKSHGSRICRFACDDDQLEEVGFKVLDMLNFEKYNLPPDGSDPPQELKDLRLSFVLTYLDDVRKGLNESRNYVSGQIKYALRKIEEKYSVTLTAEDILECAICCCADREKFELYIDCFLPAVAGNYYWPEKRRHHCKISEAKIAPPGRAATTKLVWCIPPPTEALGVLMVENFLSKWQYIDQKKVDDPNWEVSDLCCYIGVLCLCCC